MLPLYRILCLQAQSSSPDSSRHQNERLEKMATTLEQHLFNMAPTLQDYSNVQTLELRLKIVLQRLRRKKQQGNHHRRPVRSPSSTPSKVSSGNISLLKQQLGDGRYHQVQQLIQTIQREKQQLVGATCTNCRMKDKDNSLLLPGATSFGSEFPPPVKNLFFQTPLIGQWERHLKNGARIISWEPLIQQAQANLEAFQQWKHENFVCPR